MIERETRLEVLDGIRGFAALVVVVSHISNSTGILGSMLGKGAGQLGVMLFFTLSGFLMVHVTHRKHLTFQNITKFYYRRASRVIPLYYFILFASFVIILASSYEKSIDSIRIFAITDIEDLICHLTMLRGKSIFWTIPVEVFFYAIFPVFWWLGRRRLPYLFVVVAALMVTQFLLNYPAPFGNVQFLKITVYGHYFLLGIVTYHVCPRLPAGAWANFVFVAALLGFMLCYPQIQAALFRLQVPAWKSIALFVVVPTLVASSLRSKIAGVIFANRVSVFLGRISYSMYLTHVVVIIYLNKFAQIQNGYLFTITALMVVVALSYATFRCIEKPARNALNGLFTGAKASSRVPASAL